MEVLAYLHLAQTQESCQEYELVLPEIKCNLGFLSPLKLSSPLAIGLLGLTCTSWLTVLSSQADAARGYYSGEGYYVVQDNGQSYYLYSNDTSRPASIAANDTAINRCNPCSICDSGNVTTRPNPPDFIPVRPSPDNNYQYGRTMAFSNSGTDVTALQQRLIRLGYLAQGLDTGFYGRATEQAIKNFQRDQGLLQDGIAGSATLAALNGVRPRPVAYRSDRPASTGTAQPVSLPATSTAEFYNL